MPPFLLYSSNSMGGDIYFCLRLFSTYWIFYVFMFSFLTFFYSLSISAILYCSLLSILTLIEFILIALFWEVINMFASLFECTLLTASFALSTSYFISWYSCRFAFSCFWFRIIRSSWYSICLVIKRITLVETGYPGMPR